MAEQKRRCVAVRSGRNTKFIGRVQKDHLAKRLTQLVKRPVNEIKESNNQSVDQTVTILHLDDVVLLSIFKYLCSDDVATMWTTHRNFRSAAVDTFSYLWKRGNETSIKVYLCSRPAPGRDWEENYELMKSLGVNATKLHIIGYQNEVVNEVDAGLLRDVLRICTKVKTATLQHINYDMSLAFLEGFGTTSVDFLFSSMTQGALSLSNLTEFTGNISPSENCHSCESVNGNIKQQNFEDFFSMNIQLRNVRLYAISSETCMKGCNVVKSGLFYTVVHTVSNNKMQLNSFIVFAENKRKHFINQANNLFVTTIESNYE